MKKAILYIRVSTDEQAERGYSLKYQEERLRQYCAMNSIEVTAVYIEDYSAKTFNRPVFKQLMIEHKNNKHKINFLLFVRWDRFSRNTTDAYAMIRTLKKINIDPQAVEQPLDLSIPENKMMLAFHLTIPEVENDRRSLNVVIGMRRAKQEGRWMATAPRGYKNVTNPDGSKKIILSEEAPIIKWAFEQLAARTHKLSELKVLCQDKGIVFSQSRFYTMFRNPVYCGKIFIPAYNGEAAELVQGLHEPLISEEVFERAQDQLKKPHKMLAGYGIPNSELALRGFIQCEGCGKNLTGSGSTGGSGIKHYYYHCTKGCKERLKASKVNLAFADELKKIVFDDQAIQLFKLLYIQVHRLKIGVRNNHIAKLRVKAQKQKDRISEAQRLMLDKQISPAEYHQIKGNFSQLIETAESQIHDDTLSPSVSKACKALIGLDMLFYSLPVSGKRQMVRLLCSEIMRFKNGAFSFIRWNEDINSFSQKPIGVSAKNLLYTLAGLVWDSIHEN